MNFLFLSLIIGLILFSAIDLLFNIFSDEEWNKNESFFFKSNKSKI